MDPVTVSAWTFLFASLVLLPFLMWERRRGRTQGTNDRRPWTGSGVGFFGVGRDPVVGVECRAHLFDSANPNLTALLASVILSERMSLVRWASLSVSLVGVLILSGFDWRHLQLANSKYLFGNVLLLACASSSFYNVYCKELLRGFTPLEVLIYGYVLAFVASVPRVAWVEHFSLLAIRDFRASTWLALIV